MMQNIKADIRRVMKQHPDLHYLGYGRILGTTPGDLRSIQAPKNLRKELASAADEVEHVVRWLTPAQKRRTINEYSLSYGVKTLCERACGTYISTGSFICGALLLGFDIRVDGAGPNACFNISKKFINQQWKALMP